MRRERWSVSRLKLAEGRPAAKAEDAASKARLESERAVKDTERSALEAQPASRTATAIDVEATMQGLRRPGDVFDEFVGVPDRRRLLATHLNCVILRPEAGALLTKPAEDVGGPARLPGWLHPAPQGRTADRADIGQDGNGFPSGVSGPR